jgi:hypothetical protein
MKKARILHKPSLCVVPGLNMVKFKETYVAVLSASFVVLQVLTFYQHDLSAQEQTSEAEALSNLQHFITADINLLELISPTHNIILAHDQYQSQNACI